MSSVIIVNQILQAANIMADQKATIGDFIHLGELLFHMRNPEVSWATSYHNDTQEFLRQLLLCNLKQTQTAAKQLEERELRYYVANSRITREEISQLTAITRTIADVLYAESNSLNLIVTKNEQLPKVLLDLPSRMGVSSLEPHQEALRDDVIQCLKAQVYRPVIVVSWALGFDLLRWWVFTDVERLKEFNLLLAKRSQKTGQRQIVNYTDFFKEKESSVLEICRDAVGALQCFSSKTYRLLETLLDDRNSFAHANFAEATEHEAKSYIERLFRVLTEQPFCR